MQPDPGDPTDRALVDQFLRTRSEAAFLRLYDRHGDGMFRFAARLAGRAGPEPAEIVQEAWLRALVLNRWREVRQREERDRRLTVIAGTQAAAAATPTSPDDTLALERAVADLPEGYREVLLLHDLEGYTHEEIARHFGIAEGTSKSQLHRARRALRVALGESEEERA
jgi:RNA polymerase sigma-70 factor, ECF subfamily